jgi:DNA-binding CsgD family transcriptional regulator
MTRTQKPWTSGEENRLLELREAGKTGGEIAVELNRTISSVYGRIYRFERMRPIPIIPNHRVAVA